MINSIQAKMALLGVDLIDNVEWILITGAL